MLNLGLVFFPAVDASFLPMYLHTQNVRDSFRLLCYTAVHLALMSAACIRVWADMVPQAYLPPHLLQDTWGLQVYLGSFIWGLTLSSVATLP